MPAKISHRILRKLASWALVSFFHEIRVVNGDVVPEDGPVIICCTHHNMMIDPGVLSCTFPFLRPIHYWAKASLFKHPLARIILTDAGNIPVDRGNKDNQVLFRGTFDALAQDEVVGLFPEGTSYTEHKILQVKDGASWAALEYTKFIRGGSRPKGAKDVIVIPAGITYTNKSKYRSSAVIEYGTPITMDAYLDQFLSTEEGAPRAAVKRLTQDIERQMVQLTINAPDWDSLFAARMARELLWEDEKAISLDEFVVISQTLVDLFSTNSTNPKFTALKALLLQYHSLLSNTRLTNSTLSSLPLPRTLDPQHAAPLPTRLSTLMYLLRDTVSSLIRLPFFLFPLIVHMPAYLVSRYAGNAVEDEEETQAQNKIVGGLFLISLTYITMFFFLWGFFWLTPAGAVVAFISVYLFAGYHTKLIDDNYEHAKRLVAAWRVLVGVWVPRKWDLDLSAVAYAAPTPAADNPFLKRSSSPSATPKPPTPSPGSAKPKKRRIPSRRLIRHVLRTRLDAARALGSYLLDLERSDSHVSASTHLAQAYGGGTGPMKTELLLPDRVEVVAEPQGWRRGKEVVSFLRARGARIVKVARDQEGEEGDWAASSEGEGEGEHEEPEKEEDLVWVPSAPTTSASPTASTSGSGHEF